MVFSNTASAQTWTDTLVLQGIVGPTCSVTVTPQAGVADNLDLAVTAGWRTVLNVADVLEVCDNAAGYDMDASSAGAGDLVGVVPANRQPYQHRYDVAGGGGWVALGAGLTDVGFHAQPATAGTNRTVDIRYNIPAALPWDTYSDTITYTMTAL